MLTGRLGPYTLLRQIAVGGMAEIYLAAVDPAADLSQGLPSEEGTVRNSKRAAAGGPGEPAQHHVAIKVIHRDNANDPDFVRMLLDEARLSVQLNHPNIVHTYDLGKEKDQYYIVMEFVDGADLFKVQQRAAGKRLSFPIATCAFIAREVARGLDFAHRLKDHEGRPLYIVHRDISPQNVLLSYDGKVKITDFGIAKAAHRAEQTQAGIIKGKYYYMSPEQAAGRIIDRRTDVFAAGILLYEMLIGEMLYYDEDLDRLLAMVRKADIAPPTQRRHDIPPELSDIVMKALRKRIDDRYQTAADFAAALDGFLGRIAPHFTIQDLGGFVTRVMDSQRNGGRLSDPTMSVVPISAQESHEDVSPTVGLSSEQVRRLGIAIRDENSLIFKSQSRLMALLGDSSTGNIPAVGTDSEAFAPTAKRIPPGRPGSKSDVDPELLEITNPLHKNDSSDDVPRVREPSGNTPSGPTGDFSQRLDAYRRAKGGFAEGKKTRKHSSSRADGGGGDVGRTEHSRSLAFERMPAPPISENHVDVEDIERRPHAREPKVELTQSDMYPHVDPDQEPSVDVSALSVDQISAESTHDGLRPAVPPAPPTLSAMSEMPSVLVASSTFAAVPMPASQSGVAIVPLADNPPEDRGTLLHRREPGRGRGRGLWGYILTAVGAATFSSVVTWNVATRLPRPTDPSMPDAAAPADLGIHLYVPEAGVPVEEPPPAPLSTTDGTTPDAPRPPAGSKSDASRDEDTQGTGTLRITSVPPGADVFIKKKQVGTTPVTVSDLPLDSDVKLELRLDGFQKKRKRVRWGGQTELDVNIKLDAASDDESGGGDPDKAEKSPTASEAPAN